MTSTIVNAAPMTRMLGTQDLSTRQLVPEPEVIPTHLPKVYIYAQKGPVAPQLVVGNSMTSMYGADSFDLRKPWATHATVLAKLINAQGNALMMERIKPDDAAPPASIRLYLDVLPTEVPVYKRNADGSYEVDANNLPIPKGTLVPGFKAKWVTAQVTPDVNGEDTFGSANPVAGDQTDTTTHVQSQRFPILDLRVSSFGNYGNNLGLRMWAPTSKSSMPIDDRLIASEKAYPFRIACVSRLDENTTPSTVETMYAEQYLNVVLKPNVIDKNTDALVSIHDVFIQSYQELNNANGSPPHYGPFSAMRVYDDNVETLLKQFHAAEVPYIDEFSDFKDEAGEEYRFNLFSGVSSQAVPYVSYQVVNTAANSTRMTENATIYAAGGSDGTMNETEFAKLVAIAVGEYANENSIFQDTAKYPESIIYDSGFPLTTKYALMDFMAIRKDTAVVVSTHDVLGPVLSASQESALAVALRTRAQMYPESEFFGTATMRCMIVGRCGTLLNSQYRKKLPLTFEIATKAAKYMGASNGKWKSGFSFDTSPNNNINMFTDVNVTYTPATVRNKDWANGLVWVDNFDRKSLYFPALKTVYDNDTSVLNSFFTMMACVELEKIGERARRQYSGVSSLTNSQLVERVNEFVDAACLDKFDGRFVIKPDAYYTAADIARGYSWTLNIKIYAPNMKTVQTLQITSYRISDLTTA